MRGIISEPSSKQHKLYKYMFMRTQNEKLLARARPVFKHAGVALQSR